MINKRETRFDDNEREQFKNVSTNTRTTLIIFND